MTFIVACPCGAFIQGLSLMGAWFLMRRHPTAKLMMDEVYDEQVAEVLAEAERVVMA